MSQLSSTTFSVAWRPTFLLFCCNSKKGYVLAVFYDAKWQVVSHLCWIAKATRSVQLIITFIQGAKKHCFFYRMHEQQLKSTFASNSAFKFATVSSIKIFSEWRCFSINISLCFRTEYAVKRTAFLSSRDGYQAQQLTIRSHKKSEYLQAESTISENENIRRFTTTRKEKNPNELSGFGQLNPKKHVSMSCSQMFVVIQSSQNLCRLLFVYWNVFHLVG